MTDLSDWRSRFNSLQNYRHLISNSLGAMPNRAREMADRYANVWAERGARAWAEDWWLLPREVGDMIAGLLGADPDTVSMHPNVTTAEAVVASCFDLSPERDKVVMIDMEFPSILYIYREWLRGKGRLELVKSEDGITIPTEKILQAIDDRTLLVPISHVLFRSSYIVEIEPIIQKAHSVGAMVIMDVFQSLGTVPFNVSKLDVDFAVGGCLKWLCGGAGACFLYVRPDLTEKLYPRLTGWLSHKSPFSFDVCPIDRTSGSYRFMNGTPVIPALYTCQPGLEIVAEIGIDAIRKRSVQMTSRLLQLAKAKGWSTTTPIDENCRAGTVAIDIDDGAAIAEELNNRNFLVDYRPNAGIRISPHFYNTDQEIEEVVAEIDDIIGEKLSGQ